MSKPRPGYHDYLLRIPEESGEEFNTLVESHDARNQYCGPGQMPRPVRRECLLFGLFYGEAQPPAIIRDSAPRCAFVTTGP
jgi:hypothetical protein